MSRWQKITKWFDQHGLFTISAFLLAFIPLYPKLPLFEAIPGYLVRVRLEDMLVLATSLVWLIQLIRKKIAWKTTGVIEVDNEIRVVPRMKQTDAVIERKIMEVVQNYRRLQGAKIAVAVKAGAVHLRINLDHPSDVLFLKHRVAEIDGVVSIDIQAKFFA